jgi:hypothetical protein
MSLKASFTDLPPRLQLIKEVLMFEAVQFIEERRRSEPTETNLGTFEDEIDAVVVARSARDTFRKSGSDDYAWWVVREVGARLANFIADSRSAKEFALDLTSGELVEVPR